MHNNKLKQNIDTCYYILHYIKWIELYMAPYKFSIYIDSIVYLRIEDSD